jgi:mRNA-degrading endonuclease toxin of MazEF toxin-antitoxin module
VSALRRGDIVRTDELPGAVLWLVVSNDERNQAFNTVLVARIMPFTKAQTATIVPLSGHDPVSGFVLVDYIATEPAAIFSPSGKATAATVDAVSRALRVAMP